MLEDILEGHKKGVGAGRDSLLRGLGRRIRVEREGKEKKRMKWDGWVVESRVGHDGDLARWTSGGSRALRWNVV